MKKGFTITELLVAVGILAIIMSFASVIFRVSIDSHRMAMANAEIMQKLRAITDQLNADFKNLRKDAEIYVVWAALPRPDADPCDPNSYERFDRIMFFADGDFQSYGANPRVIRGNMARICYIPASKPNPGGDPITAENQKRHERILARTQHILTDDPELPNFLDPNGFTGQQWYDWNNRYEYDKITLEAWKNIPLRYKVNMLAVIADIELHVYTPTGPVDSNVVPRFRGAQVDTARPDSIHMLLCQGVGQFKVQGWYEPQKRWVPELDPDGNGNLADTDFFLRPYSVPAVLYPYTTHRRYGWVTLGGMFTGNYFRGLLNEEHFNEIPGLGRALKFTFTLYDSRGIIKNGRTFTHIVYLDK